MEKTWSARAEQMARAKATGSGPSNDAFIHHLERNCGKNL